jgi:hypothetical protein
MDGLNKLIQDIEQELNKNSNNDSQMADGFEPTTYESHSGNSDEILLSAYNDQQSSLAELNQNSHSGNGDEIFPFVNDDEESSSAELSQNFHKGDSDGILLSTEINENNITNITTEHSETEDSNEIILSETDQSKDEVSSRPEEIICTTCQNPGINQVDPNLHREESDNIIWSNVIRILNTPIAKTNLDEANKTLHSFKGYIDKIHHQYSGANLTSDCTSEDEESSHETVIESLDDTTDPVLVVRDEKDLSYDSEGNEISPEPRRLKSPDKNEILSELDLTNHQKGEKDKFSLVDTDKGINYDELKKNLHLNIGSGISSFNKNEIEFRQKDASQGIEQDKFSLLVQLDDENSKSEPNADFCAKDEEISSKSPDNIQSIRVYSRTLEEGIALSNNCAKTRNAELNQNKSPVEQDETFLLTDNNQMTGSDKFSQTTKDKVDENGSISSTISSTLIKSINQATDEFSPESKDTLQRDQSDNQPLGEGIALPSKSIDSREFPGHRLNQDENKEEISSFAEKSDDYHAKSAEDYESYIDFSSESSQSQIEDEIEIIPSTSTGTNTESIKRNQYVFEDGIPAASSYTVGKDKKIEIFVHPTGFRTFIEDIGEINRCTLMDTLLSHKTELIIQFIDLINSMVHKEYENRYPLWAEKVKDVTNQISIIDSRWGLKLINTQCRHILIRQSDCTCDPPFNYQLSSISDLETYVLSKPKSPTIDELMRKRRVLVNELIKFIEDCIIDGYYPQFDLTWVVHLRRISQKILNIDPHWKLECIRETFKCLKIQRVSCDCGHQK